MYRKNRLNIPLFFFSISFLIVLTKLIIQNFIFNLPLDITTLITTSDRLYLPLIDSFSNFNLNPSYSEKIDNLNIISFPFLGLIINTLFYKFFGIYSFLILEIILSMFITINVSP